MEKTKFAMVSLPVNEYRFSILGPLFLASYVKRKMENVEVRIIDNTFEDVKLELNKFNPGIIGITTFTSYYNDALELAKIVKKNNPNIKLIVGGPHISSLPESFDKVFDYGVVGEGEKALVELIDAIISNKDISKIKGIIYYKNNKLIFNKKREFSKELDWKIDYSLLNKTYFRKAFVSPLYKFESSIGIMTSLGCPFRCRFCSVKTCWSKIRFRKVDDVIKEIEDLYHNFGVKHINLYDDLFSINIPRLKEFYKKLKDKRLLGKISFSCQGRTNTITEEMCMILKMLNIKMIMFGFESGSDRILKYLKNDQSISVESHKKAVEMCKKYNISAYGGIIFGVPGEKLEDMQKGLDFIDYGLKNGVGRIWPQILVPLPGTEIWEIAKQRGKIGKDFHKSEINMSNKEKPLLLDSDVKHEDFLKIYESALNKCKIFTYRIIIKTLIKNPFLVFYLIKDFPYYSKRMKNYLKSASTD